MPDEVAGPLVAFGGGKMSFTPDIFAGGETWELWEVEVEVDLGLEGKEEVERGTSRDGDEIPALSKLVDFG